MSNKNEAINFSALKAELDSILHTLQSEEIDVDEALKNYKRGLALVSELEEYLTTAENTVKDLKKSLTKS